VIKNIKAYEPNQSSEGSKIVQKVVHMIYQEQAHKYMNTIKKSTMILYQSRIKDIYLDKSQKAYSLFIKDL